MSGSPVFAGRDFRFLLIGQTTSQFGTHISGVAVPLLAVLTLDASPWQLGLVNASATVAFAVLGLPAGAWLDRVRRRRVLIVSDLARAALLGSLPLAWWWGWLSITQLVVVSLFTGVARVFFDVGYQSYLPSLLGPGQVLAGNSAMETARAAGQFAGPGVGGSLVGLVGAANVVGIQAVTFTASAVSLLAIRTPEPAPPRLPERPRLRTQIREGLAFVVRNPVLRALALASTASNFAFSIASAVAVVFLTRTLRLPPSGVGLLVAGGSVMAMAAAALTPWLSRRHGSARILWLVLAVTGPIALIGPFAQPGWLVVLVVVGSAAAEFGQIVYAVTSLSLRQRLCPERILGRVNATMRFLIMGVFPVGALLGGALGAHVGLRPTLFLSQALLVVAAVPLYLTLRHTRDLSDLPRW